MAIFCSSVAPGSSARAYAGCAYAGSAYGRAYAGAFRNGHFTAIAEAGHMPQIETPNLVFERIRN